MRPPTVDTVGGRLAIVTLVFCSTPSTADGVVAAISVVAKSLAAKTAEWTGDERLNLDSEIGSSDVFWKSRGRKSQKNGKGGSHSALTTEGETFDLLNSLGRQIEPLTCGP